ncbi:MAG: hypothetical protein ACRD1Z_01100 [Vicinamibacteria bacterium]
MQTMVVGGRVSRLGEVHFGAALGQDPRDAIFRSLTPAEKKVVAREAVKREANVEELVGLLSICEYMRNAAAKADFAFKGFNVALEFVSKSPQSFELGTVKDLQSTVNYLRNLKDGISGTFTDDIDVPRNSLMVTAANWITFGLVRETFPSTLNYLWAELLKQLPERGIKLVIERWTGPAPDSTSEQQYEAVDFDPPTGVPLKETHIISEGARTSLLEDGKATETYNQEMQEALKSANLSAVAAVPWLARLLMRFVTKKVAIRMSQRAILAPLALAKWSVTWKGAITLTTVAALYKAAYHLMSSDVVPKLIGNIGDALVKLAEAAANVMGSVKESAIPIVVIVGIALGITLIGGAIVLVTK